MRPEVAAMVKFRRLNLLDPAWPVKEPVDAIFCRNVMIYFDKPTQRKVLDRFAPLLKPDGLLFAGHSENASLVNQTFKPLGQTVYELARRAGRRHMNAAVPGSVASHHYFDRDFDSMAVKLLPSEYYVTTTDIVLTTVLGSCVAACIVDLDAGVAGMNHFMLPEDGEPARATRPNRCATAPTRWRC